MTSLTKFVCFEVDNEFDIIAFVRSANVVTLSKVCQVISQIPSTKTWSHFSNIATLYTKNEPKLRISTRKLLTREHKYYVRVFWGFLEPPI